MTDSDVEGASVKRSRLGDNDGIRLSKTIEGEVVVDDGSGVTKAGVTGADIPGARLGDNDGTRLSRASVREGVGYD